MPQAATNVTQLAEKIAAAVPRFDPIGRRVAVSLYRELAKGEPVSVARLATLLNLRPEAVSSALSACAVFYDNGGAVIGFGGLTFAEMPPTTSGWMAKPSTRGARGIVFASQVSSARRPTSPHEIPLPRQP